LLHPEPAAIAVATEECRVVAVQDGLDLAAAPGLKEELFGLIRDGVRRLIVELSLNGQVDSSGLSVLVAAQRRMDRVGGALVVVFDDEYLAGKFTALGLDRLLTLAPSREEAVSCLGAVG
jgi:anti-sigma B factor antagonist